MFWPRLEPKFNIMFYFLAHIFTYNVLYACIHYAYTLLCWPLRSSIRSLGKWKSPSGVYGQSASRSSGNKVRQKQGKWAILARNDFSTKPHQLADGGTPTSKNFLSDSWKSQLTLVAGWGSGPSIPPSQLTASVQFGPTIRRTDAFVFNTHTHISKNNLRVP